MISNLVTTYHLLHGDTGVWTRPTLVRDQSANCWAKQTSDFCFYLKSSSIPNTIYIFYSVRLVWFQVIRDRITQYMSRSLVMWNTLPGGPWLLPSFSDTLQSFPFFYPQMGSVPGENFTAVIYATTPVTLSSSPLFRLIRTIAKSPYIHKVSILKLKKIGHLKLFFTCHISFHSTGILNANNCFCTDHLRTVKPHFKDHLQIKTTSLLRPY